jgi:arabinofuranan 3-O-arabinosyltransferase
VSLALVLLTFAQSSGQTAADTKIDLVVNPLGFLQRALTLWDPVGNAGQLQNQAYGYFFPIGPFFVLCDWLGLAPWSAQRLWQSVLVLAAFLGVVRLSRLLGVRGFWARVAAGLTYSLAPQILTELSTISASLTPAAALPWILIPLVRGATEGSPRKAAALSGVALLFAGGTNAAATLAVLPAGALWLLTRARGPRRAALIRYWLLAVALACAWWALPLLLLGRYSPPFLNWIEAAANTTATTSLSASLRGVEHWESYLGPHIWPAGWIMATAPAAIIATTAVAAAGLAGLAHRRVPNRLFLCSCLGTGLILLSIGHAASTSGPFTGNLRELLDGPLVAFRNIHKFDPLVRLAIAIGVGHLLSRTQARWWLPIRLGKMHLRFPARGFGILVAVSAAVVALTPAIGNHLVPEPRANTIPAWWTDAGQWLSDHSDGSRALVVPGAARPTYFWGATIDDALQPVTSAPWIVRNSAPLAQPGTIRLLDVFENRLAAGHGDTSLAQLMARSGIGYVVVRNDLDTGSSLATPYNIVRTTLITSPGFTPLIGFGPELGAGPNSGQLVDGGAGVSRKAIEIFRVEPEVGRVGLLRTDSTVTANGSSDSLAQMVDRGLPASTPVLLGDDRTTLRPPRPGGSKPLGPTAQLEPTPQGPVPVQGPVATDGIRRQQAGFGNRFIKSQTLTKDQRFVSKRKAYDYLPDPEPPLSTMRYIGIAGVTASSSGSDVYASYNNSSANSPWSALDGDPSTTWRSGSSIGATGQWIEVRLDGNLSTYAVGVSFAAGATGFPTQVEVRTDTGRHIVGVKPNTLQQFLPLPAGSTRTIRLTVRSTTVQGFGTDVGISSLSIPGVSPQRTLDVPGAGAPRMLMFDAATGYRDGCLEVSRQPACDNALVTAGEEDNLLDRTVKLTRAKDYLPTATVRLLASSAVNRKLDARLPIRATASSVASRDPRIRAGAAVDNDASTAWSAAAGDSTPTLALDLRTTRTVRGLRLETYPNSLASAPRVVRVDAGAEHWTGEVPKGGTIRLNHPARTRTVTITVLSAQIRSTTSTLTGRTSLLPAGINTVTIDDGTAASPAELLAGLPEAIDFGCKDGLQLTIDGNPVQLSVHARTPDVLAGNPVEAVACTGGRPIPLRAGTHRFRLGTTAWSMPRSMTLTEPDFSLASTLPSPGTVTVQRWDASNRRVQVEATARSILVVRENFNAGWRAKAGGQRLTPIQVDGWQQGFIVPAGTSGTIALTYGPQRAFNAGLIVGLLAVLCLIFLAFWPRGRRQFATVTETRLRPLVQLVLLSLMSAALAGAAGLLTLAAVIVVFRLLWPGGRQVPVWLCAATFLVAGIGIASAPAVSVFRVANSDLTQLLTVAAVCLALVGGLPRTLHGRDP